MSWEKEKGPKIVIGILHREIIDTNMLYNALMLERPGWRSLVLFESGRPYDIARSNVATRCLETGAEWCFFWDSDLLIPPNTITRLTSHNLPIVGGLYFRRHPEVWPEIFRDVGGGVLNAIPAKEVPFDGLPFIVDGIGAGCLLIHRRVFEVLKEHVPLRSFKVVGPPPGEIKFYEFFRWGIGREDNPNQPSYSEDLTFCMLAKKHGFKIHCDPAVRATHILNVGIKDGQFTWLPLEGG
jgi:hypothetical protein